MFGFSLQWELANCSRWPGISTFEEINYIPPAVLGLTLKATRAMPVRGACSPHDLNLPFTHNHAKHKLGSPNPRGQPEAVITDRSWQEQTLFWRGRSCQVPSSVAHGHATCEIKPILTSEKTLIYGCRTLGVYCSIPRTQRVVTNSPHRSANHFYVWVHQLAVLATPCCCPVREQVSNTPG